MGKGFSVDLKAQVVTRTIAFFFAACALYAATSLDWVQEVGGRADRNAAGDLLYKPNPGLWHGRSCHPGENWDASMCNQKLIGAQYFCGRRPRCANGGQKRS